MNRLTVTGLAGSAEVRCRASFVKEMKDSQLRWYIVAVDFFSDADSSCFSPV
jgi:hypothetical protein